MTEVDASPLKVRVTKPPKERVCAGAANPSPLRKVLE